MKIEKNQHAGENCDRTISDESKNCKEIFCQEEKTASDAFDLNKNQVPQFNGAAPLAFETSHDAENLHFSERIPLLNKRPGEADLCELLPSTTLSCSEENAIGSEEDFSSDEVFSPHTLNLNRRKDICDRPQPGKCGRKKSVPRRSAERGDPKFKGVTFQVRTFIENGASELWIAGYYNCKKAVSRASRYRQSLSSTAGTSSGTGEDSPTVSHTFHIPEVLRPQRRLNHHWGSSAKQCASCGTRKTPLWRDAEDGTPLCNACGIRYKKYRIRCTHCWHIPRKETKAHANCGQCGEFLKLPIVRNKTI